MATLHCSFCSKSEHQVRKLVAGPSVFICDECVSIAGRLMDESASQKPSLVRRLIGGLRRFVSIGLVARSSLRFGLAA